MDGITDTVIGDAALREVVRAYFRTAVACADKGLASAGDVIDHLIVAENAERMKESEL